MAGRPKKLQLRSLEPEASNFVDASEKVAPNIKAGRATLARRIGEFILAIRTEKNVTAESTAKAIGITRATLSSWENGKALPDVYSLFLLLKCFGISIDRLVYGDDEAAEIWMNWFYDQEAESGALPVLRPYPQPEKQREKSQTAEASRSSGNEDAVYRAEFDELRSEIRELRELLSSQHKGKQS